MKKHKSDGCTFFPDGTKYKHCCIAHDYDRIDPDISLREADSKFFKCMKKNSNILLAIITYVFVRAQGLSRMPPRSFVIMLGFISFIAWFTWKYG